MARYDQDRYGPQRGGYDSGWQWQGPRTGGWGGGPADAAIDSGFQGSGIYGPGRYGLGPYHQRLRTRRRPDDELREEVQEALFYDSWVDADAIEVSVRDGVVTLTGELPDYGEVRYATDDAWDVEGVLGVRSELRVRE